MAIVTDNTSIYVGGSITQTEWLHDQPIGWAHVGRIDIQSRMWVWQKQFSESTTMKLTTVTALSISPNAKKLACHGFEADGIKDYSIYKED